MVLLTYTDRNVNQFCYRLKSVDFFRGYVTFESYGEIYSGDIKSPVSPSKKMLWKSVFTIWCL